MPEFTAIARNGDWDGSAAADNAVPASLHSYLQAHRFIKDDEFLVAASVTVLNEAIRLSAFVYPGGKHVDFVKASIANTRGPIKVRQIDIPLPLSEFVELFHRLSIVLTCSKLGLEEREYQTISDQ